MRPGPQRMNLHIEMQWGQIGDPANTATLWWLEHHVPAHIQDPFQYPLENSVKEMGHVVHIQDLLDIHRMAHLSQCLP